MRMRSRRRCSWLAITARASRPRSGRRAESAQVCICKERGSHEGPRIEDFRMRMRIRHYRVPKARHGSRARRVSEAMWGNIFGLTFGYQELEGIELEPSAGLPKIDEHQ